MVPLPTLSSEETSRLKQSHLDFGNKVLHTGISTAAASFLLIGALIVIFCASLCFMLPGINVIKDIVQPAYIPACAAILVSLPFIILAVKNAREKNTLRDATVIDMITLLDKYDIPSYRTKQSVEFILSHFLEWPMENKKLVKNKSWTDDYQKKLIGNLKEKLGTEKEERNKRQEKMVKVFDKVLVKISKKK